MLLRIQPHFAQPGRCSVYEWFATKRASTIFLDWKLRQTPPSWYYRCVGADGDQCVALEFAAGRLVGAELLIYGAPQRDYAYLGTMETIRDERHMPVALEPCGTQHWESRADAVDVRRDVIVGRYGDTVVVDFGLDRHRYSYTAGGVTWYATAELEVVGLALRPEGLPPGFDPC